MPLLIQNNKNIDLSIIIPVYNEAVPLLGEPRILNSLRRLRQYMAAQAPHMDYEVLVVDACSPDGSADLVADLQQRDRRVRLLQAGPKPAGQFTKGRQVAMGMLLARGRYAMFMDADLATPLWHLQQVFSLMARNLPIGIGVRDLQRSHHGVRKLVSVLGNLLVRSVLIGDVPDTQCGFKAFRRDVAQQIFARQRIHSWGFDLEVLALAQHYHYDLALINVLDWQDIAEGSKVGERTAFKAALKVLPDIMWIKWNLLTGRYDQQSLSAPA
ncbi:MAG: glycosyltransferase [Pseudomonas sp.]|uniref:glycosyltransferase n=1 Tax=Pseudomonas abieticivorans TaxID=2931382 RepID=UPI0020BE2F8C|nr:glycosyltransferase [Pseudomonas sp. PIA16]MDE1165383.1 glycosyltransferase [Pseudomonas sp.]